MTRAEKAQATRKRNLRRRFAVAVARLAALKDTPRLMKIQALAADPRGDENTRAIAQHMAGELGAKILKQTRSFGPPPLPTTLAELVRINRRKRR